MYVAMHTSVCTYVCVYLGHKICLTLFAYVRSSRCHACTYVQGGGRRANVKGGVMCLNRTNRPSVCMYQGCVGSELEVVSNTPSVYIRKYESGSVL